MLQPRESRVLKRSIRVNNSSSRNFLRWTTQMTPHYWICHKIPYSSRILVSLLGFFLLVLPNTFSQHTGASNIVEPTPVLRLNDEELTTVLLVNNDNRLGDHVHGRFLNVRPEVGLLTSTARTFIQEGIITEYATQVLGTTLDNGRLYAQLLRKSSRVLFEPSVITSWVGDNLQTKAVLQSHNDLSNAEQPDWQDIDDHLILGKNAFVGNTDYVGLNLEAKVHKQGISNDGATPSYTTNGKTDSSTASPTTSAINAAAKFQQLLGDKVRKIAANKVLPVGDLPTYTVKNFFSPSGYSWNDSSGWVEDTSQEVDVEEIQRSPKFNTNQIMGRAQGSISQGAKAKARPSTINTHHQQLPVSRVLSTTTYYGFSGFTTTVGDSVIVFSPSTTAANINFGHVTSIKGEATLSGVGGSGDNEHVAIVPITIMQELIEPTYVKQMTTHASVSSTGIVDDNLQQQVPEQVPEQVLQFAMNITQINKNADVSVAVSNDDDKNKTVVSEIERITTTQPIVSEVIEEAINESAPLESSELTLDVTHASSTMTISNAVATKQTPAKTMLSIPSNEDILRIYASLASAESTQSSLSSVYNQTDTVVITMQAIKTNSNQDSKTEIPVGATQVTSSNIDILGGATTIFYEDDPFANFIESITAITNAGDVDVVTATMAATAQPNTSTTSSEKDTTTTTTSGYDSDIISLDETTMDEEEETVTDQAETSSLTPRIAVIAKEIDALDEIDLANCMRTSQIFLTQLPKTLTLYTTHLVPVPVDGETEKTSTSIETNIVPSYTIEAATKHYCLQTKTIENTTAQLEKPTTEDFEDSGNEKVESGGTTPTIMVVTENLTYSESTTETTSPQLDEEEEEEEEEENTTDVSVENGIAAVEDEADVVTDDSEVDTEEAADDDGAEEFDLIYRTLYTTYTYLTTFFHDDTTSISSHKEVVTNVITSTLSEELNSDRPETELSQRFKDITPTTTTKFVVPTDLESLLHNNEDEDTETSFGLLEATPLLDGDKVTKTYYTTYTYYTTIFADGETEVMSRTEVFTNIVKNSISPTVTVTTSSEQSTIKAKSLDDSLVNEVDNIVLEARAKDGNMKPNYSTMQRDLEYVTVSKDFSPVTLVTDVRSSSSTGKQQIINNNQISNFADPLEDQISSESNTEEIIPSATVLLQTSFTTFTYYTTMYSGEKTNIISRLETVTNVVTETLQPTKVLNLEEATLPITYFTTFTYWTKLSKDGEITTLSREETVSNIETPTAAIASTPVNPSIQEVFTVKVTDTPENVDVFNAVVAPLSEPTTYYTTYTYYTTSYVNDQTITYSRFETITNVMQPTASTATQAVAGGIAIVSAEATKSELEESVVTDTNVLPDLNGSHESGPIILSYDSKKIIDADGISTLYFATKVIETIGEGGFPTEVTSSSSSLHIDEVKKALLPTTSNSIVVNAEGSTVRQHKTGLVRHIEGTKIVNHITTLYQSKVIGTVIDNRYAQIIESTSSFLFEKTKSALENEFSIKPTTVPEQEAVAPTATETISAILVTMNVSPDVVQGSISDNSEDHTAESLSEHEEEVAEGESNKNGLPVLAKKRTFTPVIRPFASRNRPQFAPKKKNGSPSSVTIITRSDFTPTITATPALKSSARFSGGPRRGGISSSGLAQNAVLSASSRRFSRPLKGSTNQPFGGAGSASLLSSTGFNDARNRLSSSKGSPTSSSRRISSSIRPSSSGGFRAGFSSVYAGNSRLRLKPTSVASTDQQSTATELPANENNSEEENSTQDTVAGVDGVEEQETVTENSRRNQNPLLRFRRPPVSRPAGFTPAVRPNNNANSQISPRRNPLAARAKQTTVAPTTTSTTSRSRPRSFQRPTVGSLQGRARQQNSLFPPRGLLQAQQPVAQELEENKETKKENDDFNDVGEAEDESEYDEEEEGDEDGDDGTYRRRRSNNKINKTAKSEKPTLKNLTQDLKSKKIQSSRNKREADTSFETRSTFRNRFRQPRPTAGEEKTFEPEMPTSTSQPSRARISSRFNSRYQNPNLHHTSTTAAALTTIHRAIRPTRPTTTRAQFTLREKDITTTSTQKGLTRNVAANNFRRPQTAASARRTTPSPSNNRRLKNYSSNTIAVESTSRGSNSRSRNGSIGSTQRGRGTSVRGRSRNDYNGDSNGNFDGTITVTHVVPAEVTVPVINGKVTEYKKVVTAKTSIEVLSPQQYSTFIGSNGQSSLALTREDSTVNFAGATEITQYVLQESATTTVTFTPTTIRGRKTSFSHVIPSTVYSVQNLVSTVQPQISANAPLANILLSQLLLGNIGLPNNPLLGAIGGVSQSTQLPGALQNTQVPATPITEFRTHTSTYVTTLFEGMSTVLPVTFQGKKILTTIYDTTAQTITATEFITDTIISTPTQQPAHQAQVNTLLLQQLLLQQQLQPQADQQQLLQGLLAEQSPALLLLSDNLQELDTNNIKTSNQAEEDETEQLVQEVQTHKTNGNFEGKKKSRKSGKTHKRNKQQQQVDAGTEESSTSVITIYVSGRRPVLSSHSSSPYTVPKLTTQNGSKIYRSHVKEAGTMNFEESNLGSIGSTAASTVALHLPSTPSSSSAIRTQLTDDLEIDYLENDTGYSIDSKENAEVARYNLATRIMSNGVEVIIAGDKSKTVDQNAILSTPKTNILRILQSQSQKPMTLAPSTLKDQMILVEPSIVEDNYDIPMDTNQFITKTCLTTYTYRTTYIQNGLTMVESREKVISNIATEERNYLKLSSPLSLGVTLSRTPEFAVGVFPTTYFYYNTIYDGELPLVMTTRHTLSNTITGPDDFISYIQPSEAATPIHETNTYYKKITLSKTVRDRDSSFGKIVSNANILTQVVVTESLPPRRTTFMTSYFAYNDAFDTTLNYMQTPQSDVVEDATEQHDGIPQILPTPLTISKNSSMDAAINAFSSSENSNYDLHIYATKTFLTTFTYYTTTLLKNFNAATAFDETVATNAASESSTVVNFHTRVMENVISETIPNSLLGPNLLQRFNVELKKSKNQRKVIVTQVTLIGGQTLDITAMNIHKPTQMQNTNTSITANIIKQEQLPASEITTADASKHPSKTSTVVRASAVSSNYKLATVAASNLNGTIAMVAEEETDGADVLMAESQQQATYVRPNNLTFAAKPEADTKIAQPSTQSSNIPGAVNQIIESLNLQRLTALRPVFNAMAGLLNNNFGHNAKQSYWKYAAAAQQQPPPLHVESKHAMKNISASGNYEANKATNQQPADYYSYSERPIYIPVQNLETVSGTMAYKNLSNPTHLTPPQSLYIQPPAADVALSKANWHQEAANKLLQPLAADSKQHKSSLNRIETPLLNGGIPISPGEVITANSDVIIGRPNGIQHPREMLSKSKSSGGQILPEGMTPPTQYPLMYDNNAASTSHVLSQQADVTSPYTTFYQHFIQHPHPQPYKKRYALPNISPKIIQFRDQHSPSVTKKTAIPLSANFNESFLRPPPPPTFMHSNVHAKLYAPPPPTYIQLPPPVVQDPIVQRQKVTNQLSYQHHIPYTSQGYTEANDYLHAPAPAPEQHKIYNFNKELQNNEILEIKRIPEVFSTDLPPETEFPHSYINTPWPLEVEATKQLSDHKQYSPDPELLAKVKPNHIKNVKIPHNDNEATATSMLHQHSNKYYEPPATLKPPLPQTTYKTKPAVYHQKINFDTHLLSHNVNINAPPLTFKKDNDEFPLSTAPVLGQIPGNKMNIPLTLQHMPLVKIPTNEAQVQVELTPQSFIGSVIEPNNHAVGNYKSAPKYQQLVKDESAIGSFALEPQLRGVTSPTTQKQQLANYPNKNHNHHVPSNYDLKLEQSNPMLSPPTSLESTNSPSSNGVFQSMAEYTVQSQPHPPHNNVEKEQVNRPKTTKKKQRHPTLDNNPRNTTNISIPKTTLAYRHIAPPNYTQIFQRPTAVDPDQWIYNLVTADSSHNDGASYEMSNNDDQKVAATYNNLKLPLHKNKQSYNPAVMQETKIEPYLLEIPFIREINNKTPTQQQQQSSLPQTMSGTYASRTPVAHSNHIPTIPPNQGRPFDTTTQINVAISSNLGKPFETSNKLQATRKPLKSQPAQIFVTLSEPFKPKLDSEHITTKVPTTGKDGGGEILKIQTQFKENIDEEDEIFDYFETSNLHNFVSVNTTHKINDMDASSNSKATPTTTMIYNNNKDINTTTRNNKNNSLRYKLTPALKIQPQKPPTEMSKATTQQQAQQHQQFNQDVIGLNPPPPPTPPTPQYPHTSVETFSLPTFPYMTINHTDSGSNIKIQRFSLPPVMPTSKSKPDFSLKTQTLTSNIRVSSVNRPTNALTSNLSPTKRHKDENVQLQQQTPMLSSTPFAISTSINFVPNIQQLDSTRIRFKTLADKTKAKITSTSQLATKLVTQTTQQLAVVPTNTTNSQLPTRQITNKITEFITNTQVLPLTTTLTTFLTTNGQQSIRTLTFTKTQIATVPVTTALLQPTRVKETKHLIATVAAPTLSQHSTVLATTTLGDNHSLYNELLSNHKPYENHTINNAFKVDVSKFSGIAHPSVEMVLPDAVIIQQQKQKRKHNLTTARTLTTSLNSSNQDDASNSTIFIVMTDSKLSKKGNNKGIFNILEAAQPAIITSTGTYSDIYNADAADTPLDYYDNVSFDFPTLDEVSAPNLNKANHVLLGGVLIATPPKSSSNQPVQKPYANVLEPNATTSFDSAAADTNFICQPLCKVTRNEICMRGQQTSNRCVCRPGFARMFPDRPCKPTYTYKLQILLHRLGKELLNFEESFYHNDSEEFRQLAAVTHDAVDRMVMQSDFRDVYHGVQSTSFEPIPLESKNDYTRNGTVANFLIQLSDNSDEKRLATVFKKYLRQSNYSIGGTELYTSRNGVENMAVVDFDECMHKMFHDCSENARCFNLQGTYTCSCQDGYADLSENAIYPGRLCSAEMLGCEMCHFHGKCVTPKDRKNNRITGHQMPFCECFPWYTGATCQLNLKILLITLIAIGSLLFILLLFCIMVTCTKRNRYHNANSALVSGMHKLNWKNTRLTSIGVGGGMQNKKNNADNRAMIKDSSSETSQNSLPYALKETSSNSKKHHVHHYAANVFHDKQTSSLQMINQQGAVSPTLISTLEHTIDELQHYPEQTDRSLTVMIPRAKYHSSVLPSTHLLHNQLTMERISHQHKRTTTNMTISGGADDELQGLTVTEPLHLSSNNLPIEPKKSAIMIKRVSQGSQKFEDKNTSNNTSVGALVSAGFEVSATVSSKLLNNTTSNAPQSSSITTNDSVSTHNLAGAYTKHRYDNTSTDSEVPNPTVNAGTHEYSAAASASTLNAMHYNQYLSEMQLHASKTELSENHDSESNNNYRNGKYLTDSMDIWLDIMHQTKLAAEARSFEDATLHAPTKSIRSCCGNNDEANTMAERDIGSTFLLPHTHLYKPERLEMESDISGFDSV